MTHRVKQPPGTISVHQCMRCCRAEQLELSSLGLAAWTVQAGDDHSRAGTAPTFLSRACQAACLTQLSGRYMLQHGQHMQQKELHDQRLFQDVFLTQYYMPGGSSGDPTISLDYAGYFFQTFDNRDTCWRQKLPSKQVQEAAGLGFGLKGCQRPMLTSTRCRQTQGSLRQSGTLPLKEDSAGPCQLRCCWRQRQPVYPDG